MTETHRRPSHWEVLALGVVFAVILAVLTYYGGMHPVWQNRLACAIFGAGLGFPAAAALLTAIYRNE